MAAETVPIDLEQLEASLKAQAKQLGDFLKENGVQIAIEKLSAEPVEALGEIMGNALLKGARKDVAHLYGVELRFSMLAAQVKQLLASEASIDFTHHAVYAWYLHVYGK